MVRVGRKVPAIPVEHAEYFVAGDEHVREAIKNVFAEWCHRREHDIAFKRFVLAVFHELVRNAVTLSATCGDFH